MFKFDKSDIQRIAVSSIGALAMAATSVLAAAGPAKAASPNAPLTVGDWQARMERQLDGASDRLADGIGGNHDVTLAARFTADGDYAGADVVRSSGSKALDRRAVSIANRLAYPALPAGYRGAPQTVTMKLFFGDAAAIERARRGQVVVEYARNNAGNDAGSQIAAR